MSASSTFVENARVQGDKSNVTDSPESWGMSDNVMMHLFAQSRHIEARMTASTNMSEIAKMVSLRSMQLNFQMALGCAVMVEWCYMREMEAAREMSGSHDSYQVRLSDYYGRLGEAWNDKYEIAKKFYNAPIATLCAEMDKIDLPGDMPELTEESDSSK